MADLILFGFVVIAGTSFILAKKNNRVVRNVAFGLFVGGFSFSAIILYLSSSEILRFSGHPPSFLFLGPILCLIGVVSILGYLLERAGSNGRLSMKTVALASFLGIILVTLSMFNSTYVDRANFDHTVPPSASVIVIAHGFPVAFIADLSDDRLGLHGYKIHTKRLIINWLAWFYVALMLILVRKRLWPANQRENHIALE